METIKFSVIIPAYKYAEYIKEAINSVLDQTYTNYEIIVVDDGSPDNTGEVVASYPKELPIKYVRTSNRGLPSARNTGIMNSTGNWILPLDADDRISPIYLERIVETINENPDVDVVYCDLQHFGDRTDRVSLTAPLTKETFRNFNPLSYCSAIRKTCLLENGGYNVKMVFGWEDWAVWIDLFLREKKFVRIPEAHFFYRRHGTSMIDTSYKPEAVQYSTKLLRENYPKLYDDENK